MAQTRENKHTFTRHAVTAVLVRPCFPAAAVRIGIMMVLVAWKKEVAP